MVLVFAFVTALLLTIWLASSKSPLCLIDTPNKRSLHKISTPRTGGVAIVLAIATGWAALVWRYGWPHGMIWIVGASGLVAVIAFWDDMRALSVSFRLLVHGVAATLLVAGGFTLFDGWGGILVTLLAVIWKGFPEAIESVFPKTQVQLCIVHMIRYSLKFVPWKDRKEVAADLKSIYTAANAEGAELALDSFGEKWNGKYPTISESWRRNWQGVIPFLAYPDYIRKARSIRPTS